MGCFPSSSSSSTTSIQFPVLGSVRVLQRRVLGEGGFASVQLGTVDASQTSIAVKRLRNSSASQRELELMRSLTDSSEPNSNHLLQLLDSVALNDQLLLALPLCRGGSLQNVADRVRADSSLAPSQADVLRWVHHTCIALATLHERSIAHRDVKPANVLLLGDDLVDAVLCDFGSAAEARISVCNADQVADLSDDLQEFTSLSFRAPELFDLVSGVTITEAIDQWALGCLLFAVCFGINPFDAQLLRGGSVELAIRNVVFEVPEHGGAKFPRCVALIRALLVAEPDARLTARQICDQLERMNS